MITYSRQESGEGHVLTLEGVADETFAPESEFRSLAGKVFIVGAKIKRINSTGTKAWVTQFKALKARGVDVTFVAISPALVEQMNLIQAFNCGFAVASAVLPFICTACKRPNFVVQARDEALALNLDNVDWPCVNCGSPSLEFDDLPEEYLSFWRRKNAIPARNGEI